LISASIASSCSERQNGIDLSRGFEPHPLHDLFLLDPVRIVEDQFEHEPIYLGFGQRVSPFLFDGVLGGQDQERIRQRKGGFPDGDLALLHGLQQGGLNLGRRAVDFVRQDDIVENRPFFHDEVPGFRAIDLGADQVGGQ
jgi:hypothetical protein